MKSAIALLIACALALPGQEILHSYPEVPPQPIEWPKPEYTKQALDSKIEGSLRIEAVIGIDGKVADLMLVQPLGKGLDEAAMETVRAWRFKPGVVSGKPRPTKVTITITFGLPTASLPKNNVRIAMAFRLPKVSPLEE